MKVLLRIVLGLVLLVAIGLGVALFSVDSLAETAVEKGGTYALGVQTELGAADIGLFSGEFELRDLRVANPEGFSSPAFLRVGRGEMALAMGSLSSDQIEAPRLLLDDIEVALERKDGKANYKEILEHLERFESGKAEPSEPGKRFIIREVVIKNVTAHVDVLPLGGTLTKTTVTIPEIRLANVGTGDDAKSVAEIVAVLVKAVLQATLEQGAGKIPAELLKDLGQSLEGLGGVALKVGEGLKEGVEKLGKGAEDLIEDVGKGLGDVLKKP